MQHIHLYRLKRKRITNLQEKNNIFHSWTCFHSFLSLWLFWRLFFCFCCHMYQNGCMTLNKHLFLGNNIKKIAVNTLYQRKYRLIMLNDIILSYSMKSWGIRVNGILDKWINEQKTAKTSAQLTIDYLIIFFQTSK